MILRASHNNAICVHAAFNTQNCGHKHASPLNTVIVVILHDITDIHTASKVSSIQAFAFFNR